MDKGAGTNKLVIVSGLTLLGADVSKYTLTQPTTNADITPASLTVTGITASSKVYDGTTNAALIVSNAVLAGVVSGDTVTLDTTNTVGAFVDKHAATGKPVTVSGLTLLGADAGELHADTADDQRRHHAGQPDGDRHHGQRQGL